MTQHVVKIWPQYFDSLASGERNAEIRPNDRGYVAGDTVLFQEWNPKTEAYTGRELERRVTYVFSGPFEAGGIESLPSGYAILSLAKLNGTYTERAPYDCMAKLAEGEPYFVLRGQDELAAELVHEWAMFAREGGTPEPKVADAVLIAERMEKWPTRKHPD